MSTSPKIFTIDRKAQDVYKFDEAMKLTGFGKYNYLMTLLCGFIALANIFETIGFSFIISSSQCDLELTLEQKGWLAAIPYVGLVSSSQLWGYLADTRGRRKMLMVSMSLGSVCSMVSSLSPNLVVFAILRLLSAALMAASNAIVQAYYGELTPKTHVDMMISVLSTIIIGSTILATGIAWGVLTMNFTIPLYFLGITYRPWRFLVICFALPFLAASVALIKAPESPKYLMSQGKNDKVLKFLKQMYSVNTGKDSSTYPVKSIVLDEQDKMAKTSSEKQSALETIWSQTVPIFKPPLLKYTMILFLISFGIYGSGNATFMWLPDILDRFYVAVETGEASGKTFCEILSVRSTMQSFIAESSNTTQSAPICDDTFKPGTYTLILAITCILTVANIVIALLLRCISKKWILLFTLGCGACSLALLYFVANFYVSWILLMIFLTTGVLIGIVSAFAVEIYPTNYRAMAVSTVLLFGRVGSIFGTNIMGYLLENHCNINFFMFSSLIFACCFSAFFLPDTKQEKKKEQISKL